MATREQLAPALLTISGVPSGVKLDELNTCIVQTSNRQCWLGRGEMIETEETGCKWVVALNNPGYNPTFIQTVKKGYFPYGGKLCAITFEETKPDNVPEAYLTSPDQRNQSVPQGTIFENWSPQQKQSNSEPQNRDSGAQGHPEQIYGQYGQYSQLGQPGGYPYVPHPSRPVYGMLPGYNNLPGQYPPQMYPGQQVQPESHQQGQPEGHHQGQQVQSEVHHQDQQVQPESHHQGQQGQAEGHQRVQPEGHHQDQQVQSEGHYQGQQVPPMENTLQSQKQDHHRNDEQDADDNLYTDAVSTLETAAAQEQRQDLPTRETSTCTVVIESLPKTASKKNLEKYFRNTEKSGGEGEATVELKEDEGKAFVTFSSAEVARTVAQKTHVLKKKQMEVKLHVPEKSQVSFSSESSDEDDDSQSTTDEDTEPIRTITVRGFVTNTTEENLELYFESKKRSDGGSVDSVTFNTNKDVAYVTFESDEVAQRVANKDDHTLNNQQLEVQLSRSLGRQQSQTLETGDHRHKMEAEGPVCTVKVTGFDSFTSDEMLEMYFESKKKSGGEDVESVVLNADNTVAYVTFEDEEVAQRVANKEDHTLHNQQLKVQLSRLLGRQQSQTSETGDHRHKMEAEGPVCTVKVTGFDSFTSDEMLEMYFESKKKSGGGDVESVVLNADKTVAYVTFEDEEVAARVVERTNHTLKNQTLLVELFDTAQENEDLSLEDDELARRTIEVTGFKSSSTSELLEMYFESKKKSDGGPLEKFEFSDDGTVFVVTFESEDVAQRVLEKEAHVVEGHALTLTQQQGDNSGGDEKVDVSRTVKVTWSMESENIEKDNLELYFESKKKSGGENIEELVLLEDDDNGNSRAARITFETKEETQRVIQKMKHTLSGTQLCVTQYSPAPKHKHNRKSAGDQEIWGATGNKTKNQSGTEEKQEPVCTVRVKGFPVEKTTDTLVYYFENTKRSGGGEVLESKVVEDEETKDVFLFLTFQTEEVAKSVVAKEKHIVDGHSLTVVLHVPPPPVPFMENYIFISNLGSTTTKECLTNFLEAKSQVAPERFIYGEKEGTVVVVFEEPPDVDKLQETCRKKELENVHLNIERVPYTSCVQVTEFADTTTPDTLKFYFENKRRSSGGEVRKVKKLDSECFLVYFEDYQVVDEVTKRGHEIEKAKLKVQPFMECLGRCSGDDTQPSIKIPEAITIEEIDLDKVKFIKNHEAMKDALEKQLNDGHAKIVWSTPVVIECTLTEKVKNARKLAADWAKNCQDSLNHFMSKLDVHTFPVLVDFWEEVKKGLSSINVQGHEPVAVVMEKKKELIKVVGVSRFADSLRKQVQEIVNRVREKKELEKQRVSETKSDLPPLKLRMLLAAKFPTNMENAFENLKVKISQRSNRNEINFDGVQVDVQGALLKMFENMAAFAERRVPDVSKYCLILYQKKPVKEYIVKKLKNQNCIGVWEATNVSLTVCTLNESLDACVELIQGCLAEKAIITAPPARKILSSEQWVEKVDEIHKRSTDMSVVYTEKDFTKVIVASTDDIHDEIVSSIEKFLKNNTILEETVNMGGGVVRFLKMNHKTDFKKIETDYSQHNVSITAFEEDQYISIRGTQEGIQYAKAAVTALANKVKSKEHEFEKPRLGYWVTSSKGKESVKQVEGQHGCAIEIKGQRRSNVTVKDRREGATSGSTNMSRSQDGSGPLIHATCTAFDDHMVYTVEGDMTELLVDVMVNTADSKLTMTGGLAKAIIRKGGKMIEKECEDFVRDNGSLDEGDVFCSTPGRLSCSMIVHVVGPHWDSGNRGEKEALKQTVFRSMVQANKGRLTSIAIPAISCGLYGYPAREATKVISNTIKDFFREEQDSSLVEVYLCDVKPQTVEHFTEALGNAFGKGYITYVPKTPRKGAAAMGGNSSDDSGDEDSLPRQVQRDQQETLMSLGKISVKIYKDEMAKQQVDVIVNTTARNLDLKNGAVSASLLKAGGPGLQQEVSANFPKGLSRDGEIAMTGGANLNCKYVFHSCLGNWADAESAKTLQGLVVECLQRAHAKNATSIALPAIGTGNLNFPRDIVAERMFKSVAVFSEANPKTSLKEVRFILYFKDHPTIKAFEAEERKWTGGQRMGQRRGRGGMESSSDQDLVVDGEGEDEDDGSFKPEAKSKDLSSASVWLTDTEIDKAMKLIKQSCSGIHGLGDTIPASHMHVKNLQNPFIQICNSDGKHWVTLATVQCPQSVIAVYDSTSRGLSNQVKNCILNLMSFDPKELITVVMPAFQRQHNEADCGLYAIAAAMSLSRGNSPSDEKYDRDLMRGHLEQCFQKGVMEEFPKWGSHITRLKQQVFAIGQCLQCKMVIDQTKQFGQPCEGCQKWLHKKCMNSGSEDDLFLCQICLTKIV